MTKGKKKSTTKVSSLSNSFGDKSKRIEHYFTSETASSSSGTTEYSHEASSSWDVRESATSCQKVVSKSDRPRSLSRKRPTAEVNGSTKPEIVVDEDKTKATNGETNPKSESSLEQDTSPKKSKTKSEGAKVKTKLTDYFVRRSSRRTKAQLEADQYSGMISAVLNNVEDGLKVVEFDGKGRGVIAEKIFRRGDFVIEYAGDIIEVNEAKKREGIYSGDESVGCYMFYFNHRGKNYCVDATAESGRLGRLVNHSRSKPNCRTKVIVVHGQARLILVAGRDIAVGEELLYDYGDRSKESLAAHPWLAS